MESRARTGGLSRQAVMSGAGRGKGVRAARCGLVVAVRAVELSRPAAGGAHSAPIAGGAVAAVDPVPRGCGFAAARWSRAAASW